MIERPDAAIYLAAQAGPLEHFAAKELCRYVFVRTGQLLPITLVEGRPDGNGFWLTTLPDPAAAEFLATSSLAAPPPADDGFVLQFCLVGDDRLLILVGGSATGTLYAVYRVAEHFGVRFYLHGDVIPDTRQPLHIPEVAERSQPLFELRGINAWGSHAEGIDLWSEQDWLAVIGQLPKLRMNFVGLHGYPEAPGGPSSFAYGAEPWTWVGPPEDVGTDGSVAHGYQASLFTTTRQGWWGFRSKPTSAYRRGAAALFERDQWGSPVMPCGVAEPREPADQRAVFDATAALLRSAFGTAQRLGVTTAIGTETPLIAPHEVRQRLGLAIDAPLPAEVVAQLYEGMFRRIAAAHPLDFYWIWTPEAWTWRGASDADVAATVRDVQLALEVAAAIDAPFRLATAGWVLGPPQDRTLFDALLPNEVPVAEIARIVGRWPIDDAFGQIRDRPKWAIPWLEDDPGLSSPQLWVGRLRKDAADARRYDCTGLMGLHWRTRVLAPNVAVLADAAWSQTWAPSVVPATAVQTGAIGGVNRVPMDGSAARLGPILGSFRLEPGGYSFDAPNGTYAVALTFLEPDFADAGKRTFDVLIQQEVRLDNFDILAETGRQQPLVKHFDVGVTDGVLEIGFVARNSLPLITAIAIEGEGTSLKLNCGGDAFEDYAADQPDASQAADRHLPCADFYAGWAASEFGENVAAEAAAIFTALDGKFPVASQWVGGAGGVAPDPRPWASVAPSFAFASDFERLRPQVVGKGALERFDYWIDMFRYAEGQARVACALGALQQGLADAAAIAEVDRAHFARERLVGLHHALVAAIDETYDRLLATLSTPGCIGNLLNWEGHILPKILDEPTSALEALLGEPLPPVVVGSIPERPRLIVMPVRTCVLDATRLTVRALVHDGSPPASLRLWFRPLGVGGFVAREFNGCGRAVYEVDVPTVGATSGIEFYVECQTASGATLFSPPAAPAVVHSATVHDLAN